MKTFHSVATADATGVGKVDTVRLAITSQTFCSVASTNATNVQSCSAIYYTKTIFHFGTVSTIKSAWTLTLATNTLSSVLTGNSTIRRTLTSFIECGATTLTSRLNTSTHVVFTTPCATRHCDTTRTAERGVGRAWTASDCFIHGTSLCVRIDVRTY
jgi:hypothetical protein